MAEYKESEAAQNLYVDPTPAYQPALDQIAGDKVTANERYATNKADITNIFGQLTTARQADVSRINEQFTQSIVSQQEAVAKRTAEARTGMAQTMASAQTAGNERGGGPTANMAASPATIAGERGIADSNSFQTIWEGQQGAIKEQTQQNLQSTISGYGFQEVQATKQLAKSLEDTLNQLSRQETGVRGELAGAKIAGQGMVRQASYNEYLSKSAAEAAQRLAATRGYYDVQQAQIDAKSKLDMAAFNESTRVQNFGDDALGIDRRMQSFGYDPAEFWVTVDTVDIANAPSASAAMAEWRQNNPGADTAVRSAANDWFNAQRYNKKDDEGLLPELNIGNGLNYQVPGATK
jgi:hypothetical protein